MYLIFTYDASDGGLVARRTTINLMRRVAHAYTVLTIAYVVYMNPCVLRTHPTWKQTKNALRDRRKPRFAVALLIVKRCTAGAVYVFSLSLSPLFS
jgi:hypothetical protein